VVLAPDSHRDSVATAVHVAERRVLLGCDIGHNDDPNLSRRPAAPPALWPTNVIGPR